MKLRTLKVLREMNIEDIIEMETYKLASKLSDLTIKDIRGIVKNILTHPLRIFEEVDDVTLLFTEKCIEKLTTKIMSEYTETIENSVYSDSIDYDEFIDGIVDDYNSVVYGAIYGMMMPKDDVKTLSKFILDNLGNDTFKMSKYIKLYNDIYRGKILYADGTLTVKKLHFGYADWVDEDLYEYYNPDEFITKRALHHAKHKYHLRELLKQGYTLDSHGKIITTDKKIKSLFKIKQ